MANSDSESWDQEGTPPLESGPSRCARYSALIFMSLLSFGSCFCYDNPGALQEYITKDMKLTTTQFSYLYSFYAWPNTVLCLLGGFLVDRLFGIRFGTVLYALIVLLGQIIFAFGSIINSFPVMLLGRLIFGIGGESLAVTQNYWAVLWFKGKELNMIFGLQMSFARAGSAVNFIVMGRVYNFVHQYFQGREGLGVTLLLAGVTCFISFLSAIILAVLDAKARPKASKEPTLESEAEKVVSLMDLKDFNPAFWFITVIVVAYYIAIFPFIALGKVFFMRKYGFSSDDSNFVVSFVYMMSAVFSPLLGLLVDKTGLNISWVFFATCSTIFAHALMTFTFESPYIGMTILGLSYSMCASALWPMISLVTPDYQLGTAYGAAQALQNLGLAVATNLAGMVVDSGGYLLLQMFFLGWLCVSLINCLLMWIHDIKTNGVLNMTVAQRNRREIMRTGSMRDRLLADVDSVDAVSDAMDPQNEQQIRNRYLSRLGEIMMPAHVYRSLR